jgi:hypothetical protein
VVFVQLEKRVYTDWRSWEDWVRYYSANTIGEAIDFLEKKFNLKFKDGVAKKYYPGDDEYEEFYLKEIKFEEIPSNV